MVLATSRYFRETAEGFQMIPLVDMMNHAEKGSRNIHLTTDVPAAPGGEAPGTQGQARAKSLGPSFDLIRAPHPR